VSNVVPCGGPSAAETRSLHSQPASQPERKSPPPQILTEEFVDELYRFLLSYEFDHSVENVWIESKEGVFSHGLDYKRLSEDHHYLDKLSKLAILLASANKPVFANVAGGAKGAGAHLLSMLAMPLAYRDNCFLKIDDAARGLTPLFGGSHRLSRLPLNLGLYLALTGDELNFEEMTQLGYLRGAITEGASGSEIRSRMEEANLFFRERAKYTDNDEGRFEEEEKAAVKRNQDLFQQHLKYRQG
jgi:enoyl-CoA hydratase/carnithine racemase